jgi:hypothetical protein
MPTPSSSEALIQESLSKEAGVVRVTAPAIAASVKITVSTYEPEQMR